MHFQTPWKSFSFKGAKELTSEEVAHRVFHLCRVYSLFLAKTKMLSLSFSLFSSSGSLQSSSNTPHIALSEFSLEVIFA